MNPKLRIVIVAFVGVHIVPLISNFAVADTALHRASVQLSGDLVRGSEARGWAGVGLTVVVPASGATVPEDFVGMSWGAKTLLPGRDGRHLFSSSNTRLITLFRNIGVTHLRVGGTTVEWPAETAIPTRRDIDDFFGFIRASGVQKVIYTFRLLEASRNTHYSAADAALARYIWSHDGTYLESFAIGNEPDRRVIYRHDWEVENFSTYLAKWRRFAAAIRRAVPLARFSGPDAGSGNVAWTTAFAAAERGFGMIDSITEHYYSGGRGAGLTAAQGTDDMLSPRALVGYKKLYARVAVPVLKEGLGYRFTEANDHYSGGVPGASNTFAGALWALGFLHWWAAHGARGVDFHNTTWVSSDLLRPDATGRLGAAPKAYGVRAFLMGSRGRIGTATLVDPARLNLSAYVVGNSDFTSVTVINNEYGTHARDARIAIRTEGMQSRRAAFIRLAAVDGDVRSTSGITLGGQTISADRRWQPEWTPVKMDSSGQITIDVPASSAVVVRVWL